MSQHTASQQSAQNNSATNNTNNNDAEVEVEVEQVPATDFHGSTNAFLAANHNLRRTSVDPIVAQLLNEKLGTNLPENRISEVVKAPFKSDEMKQLTFLPTVIYAIPLRERTTITHATSGEGVGISLYHNSCYSHKLLLRQSEKGIFLNDPSNGIIAFVVGVKSLQFQQDVNYDKMTFHDRPLQFAAEEMTQFEMEEPAEMLRVICPQPNASWSADDTNKQGVLFTELKENHDVCHLKNHGAPSACSFLCRNSDEAIKIIREMRGFYALESTPHDDAKAGHRLTVKLPFDLRSISKNAEIEFFAAATKIIDEVLKIDGHSVSEVYIHNFQVRLLCNTPSTWAVIERLRENFNAAFALTDIAGPAKIFSDIRPKPTASTKQYSAPTPRYTAEQKSTMVALLPRGKLSINPTACLHLSNAFKIDYVEENSDCTVGIFRCKDLDQANTLIKTAVGYGGVLNYVFTAYQEFCRQRSSN